MKNLPVAGRENVVIDGIPCHITFCGEKYCGYVTRPNPILDGIDEDDVGIYQPHGTYTWGWGFDCAHYGDIQLCEYYWGHPVSGATFKTRDFVYDELRKIVESIRAVRAED